ncbi:MAG: SDR family NAD(P)-dependent oxidoreductase [Gammaproteobacteria bacterium]|nr:SDR family NAD(P)-dependent oxidoreductase [Gammaproteobacteria bacterium]
MQNPKSILITGATSGIGKALAESYAKPGVFLALTGRNLIRLNETAENCRKLGAKVVIDIIEIEDAKTLSTWIRACDQIAPLDLVIANAGIANSGQEPTEAIDRAIFTTNLTGVLNTVYPSIEIMQQRKHGQIALISSLVSLYGTPYAPAYSASKAAVKVFGEALRNRLKKHNIQVNVVCPGFVYTPLVKNLPYRMPLAMPAEKAAKIIMRDLSKNKGLIAFPKTIYFLLWSLRLLPTKLIERITYYI